MTPTAQMCSNNLFTWFHIPSSFPFLSWLALHQTSFSFFFIYFWLFFPTKPSINFSNVKLVFMSANQTDCCCKHKTGIYWLPSSANPSFSIPS